MFAQQVYRFFEESVTFVQYSVQEDRLCFRYFSSEFDCWIIIIIIIIIIILIIIILIIIIIITIKFLYSASMLFFKKGKF